MGHGACMGIAWVNMKDGWMRLKHSSPNITYFCGICMFGGFGLPRHQNAHRATRRNLTCLSGVVGFEAHILWHAVSDQPKWTLGYDRYTTCFCVSLPLGPVLLVRENSCRSAPQSKRHIYDLSLWNNVRVKIYVAAVEALRKKERQDETQFTTKIDGFVSFIPHRIMLMYFFAGFFLISPCVWWPNSGPNSGFWCCVFLTLLGTFFKTFRPPWSWYWGPSLDF